MELLKLSSKKIKFAILGTIFILITGNNSAVYAVNYHFEDEFTDSPSELWKFKSYNRTSQPYQAVDHSFLIENGKLVSSGNDNGYSTNTAFIQDNTAFGAWSFDLYIPSTAQHDKFFNRLAAILLSELEMGPPNIEPNSTFYSSVGLIIENGILEFHAHDGTSTILANQREITTLQKFDISQRYDMIRTDDRFYLFIDNSIIINATLSSSIGTATNYFTISVGTGSNLSFDNLKITTDAQGVLDSIINTSTSPTSPETSTSPETTEDPTDVSDSSSLSNNDSLYFAVGTGSMALVSTVSYWRINKKKI
ncbi:MAG: hypothetical protein GPJ54_00545 [Candidatus Heimdallarchaeota archaeon]|nr:hypothetical protein [Candidatus Heimdallarchaeota archaeon]